MNAQHLVDMVYSAQRGLERDIATLVNARLAELSDQTGLILGDIHITTLDATAFRDPSRRWVMAGAQIEYKLPSMIAYEG